VDSSLLAVDTAGRTFVDLTGELARFCAPLGDGLVNAFAPHATAGLALVEVGSGSEHDVEEALRRLLPRDDRYRHRHGSEGHGADHVLPAFVSPSVSIPVLGGAAQLGPWQSLVLVDTNRDNPRRHIRLSFVAG
jgi:secondary thiamine-phosphate synthase enzyme